MSNLKTKKTAASVSEFIKKIPDKEKRDDAKELLNIFKEVTGKRPAMWGTSIIGFGEYHFKYSSGREGDWPLTGFSPRKQNLSIYIMPGFKKYEKELKKLGKHKHSVSCLYIKKLDDIETTILKKIIKDSVARMKKLYKTK